MKKPSWMRRPFWWPIRRKRHGIAQSESSAVSVAPQTGKKVIVSFEVGKQAFADEKEDVKQMRGYVEGISCPICGNANLELVAYEKGTEGWEAAISCKSCFVKGVFNDGGFRIVKPYQVPVRER